jgi:hypothetical protein
MVSEALHQKGLLFLHPFFVNPPLRFVALCCLQQTATRDSFPVCVIIQIFVKRVPFGVTFYPDFLVPSLETLFQMDKQTENNPRSASGDLPPKL